MRAVEDNDGVPPPVASFSIKNVAVFCASANGADPIYRAVAIELGRAFAKRKIGIVYGGAKVGLIASNIVTLVLSVSILVLKLRFDKPERVTKEPQS